MLTLAKNFFKEEDGLGTVEIVIIIAILVGLALIFRKNIYSFVDQVFERVFKEAGSTTGGLKESDITEHKLGE